MKGYVSEAGRFFGSEVWDDVSKHCTFQQKTNDNNDDEHA